MSKHLEHHFENSQTGGFVSDWFCKRFKHRIYCSLLLGYGIFNCKSDEKTWYSVFLITGITEVGFCLDVGGVCSKSFSLESFPLLSPPK